MSYDLQGIDAFPEFMEPGPNRHVAISIHNVGKCYRIYDNPKDRLKQALWRGRKRFFREFWALRGISFHVLKGETLGIIGQNGAGKSTLLQIIAGTLTPTEGEVQVNGPVSALLELGSGFNPEYTGRENVFINASILGMSYDEIKQRFDDIAAFADIGDFINQPTKIYSSGMVARLAFAVAVHVDPQVLIVDEILAVGDIRFTQKCVKKFEEFRQKGCSILLVSHSPGQIQALCDRALLLDGGRLIEIGHPKEVTELYHRRMFEVTTGIGAEAAQNISSKIEGSASFPPEAPSPPRDTLIFRESPEFLARTEKKRFGTGEARIVNVELLSEDGYPTTTVEIMRSVRLRIHIRIHQEAPCMIVGFIVRDRMGQNIYGTNSFVEERDFGHLHPGERVVIEFQFPVQFHPGEYTIVSACSDERAMSQPVYYDWVNDAMFFEVFSRKRFRYSSMFYAKPEIRIQQFKDEPFPQSRGN